MTEEEYRYHRERAIEIDPFGLCSRMKSGKIKIEGHAPMTENQVMNWIPQRHFEKFQKIRSLI